MEYKPREDSIQFRRLSWCQAPEGGSKLLWPDDDFAKPVVYLPNVVKVDVIYGQRRYNVLTKYLQEQSFGFAR